MPPAPPLVGSLAPEFDVRCTARGPISASGSVRLKDYRGRWLVLIFYPRDFSLVCPTELTALSGRLEEFQQRGCELLGISTDSLETHERWMSAPRSQGGLGGLEYPLAADEDGAMSQAYGVFLELQRIALRGLFVIDPNQVLQYAVIHNTSVGRRTEEVLRVIDALQSGGLCPESWSSGTAPINAAEVLGPGSVWGHYEFLDRIGAGAFATVFKARDQKLQRIVAIKVIDTKRLQSLQNVLNEARSAAALNHPNICTVYAVDDNDGVPMIVLEYVARGSLRDLLTHGPIPTDRAIEMTAQIALGLAAAHAEGIVHGDLKPENVLVTDQGVVKLTDFGLARRFLPHTGDSTVLVDNSSSHKGLSGTPRYMAPEQAEGHPLEPSCDVFSLGLVFYELLTGQFALPGQNVFKLMQQLAHLDPEPLVATLPPQLGSILRQMLQRNPADRPLMSEVAWALGKS